MNRRPSPSWILVAALAAGACASRVERPPVTLAEAEQIRVVSERYLLAKPELAELPLPESPAIDQWGTMRLGVWILDSDGGELRLAHRTGETNVSMVRQELLLARTGGGWEVVSNAQVIYHRRRP
jgi:hypothetical protein